MNHTSEQNAEQRRDLKRIQTLSFALVETNLFLDSHPTSQIALSYYDRMKTEYDGAVAAYEEKYGPLTAGGGGTGGEVWKWVRTPWPWEIGYPESGEAVSLPDEPED